MIKNIFILVAILLVGMLYSCTEEEIIDVASNEPLIMVTNGKSKVVYNPGAAHLTYVSISGKEGDIVLGANDKNNLVRGTQSKSVEDEINFEFNNLDWTMSFSDFVQEASNSISYTITYSDGTSTQYTLEAEEDVTVEEFHAGLIGEHDLSELSEGLLAIASSNEKCLVCGIVGIVATAVIAAAVNHCDNVIEAGVQGCTTGCYEVGYCSVTCNPC